MKEIKVFAACALGASISFFTDNLIKAAEKHDVKLVIDTNTVDEAYTVDLSKYDVILVAPQVRWHSKRIRESVGDKVPVEEINGTIFAIMDGENGFKQYILPHLKK